MNYQCMKFNPKSYESKLFRNLKKNYIIFLIFLIPFNLFSSTPIETINKSECKVFETFEYTIQWDESVSIELPRQGDLESKELDLIIGEILTVHQNKNQATLSFRIFKPGEFNIPVEWRNLNTSKISKSQMKVNILSAISESEPQDSSDFLSPLIFGKFLWFRLLLIILLAVLFIYLAFILIQKYQSRPLDAILEEAVEISVDDKLESKFNQLIQKEFLSKKEFAYFITELIQSKLMKTHKIKLEDSVNQNIHLYQNTDSKEQRLRLITDSNLLENIYQSYPISTEELRKMKLFFLFAKYSNTIESISKEEANGMYKEWKTIMNSIQKGRVDV